MNARRTIDSRRPVNMKRAILINSLVFAAILVASFCTLVAYSRYVEDHPNAGLFSKVQKP